MYTRFVQKVPGMTVWNTTSSAHVDACGMANSFEYNIHIAAVHFEQLG
jgi:hypothetical protein